VTARLDELNKELTEAQTERFQKESDYKFVPRLEMLEHNIEVARSFSPLPGQEMERLRQELTPARDGMEKRLVGHLDGPTAEPDVFCA